MSYRVLPKTGPNHTISYPVGPALERLLAVPADSDERQAIREAEEAAGHIRHVTAGEVVDDIPAISIDGLLAGGDIEAVVDAAPEPAAKRRREKGGEA